MATGLPTGTVLSSAAAILRFGTRCTDFFCETGARGGKNILKLWMNKKGTFPICPHTGIFLWVGIVGFDDRVIQTYILTAIMAWDDSSDAILDDELDVGDLTMTNLVDSLHGQFWSITFQIGAWTRGYIRLGVFYSGHIFSRNHRNLCPYRSPMRLTTTTH